MYRPTAASEMAANACRTSAQLVLRKKTNRMPPVTSRARAIRTARLFIVALPWSSISDPATLVKARTNADNIPA